MTDESERYYTRIRGKVQGPFTAEELSARARRGLFGRHYAVSLDRATWKRASEFLELFPAQRIVTSEEGDELYLETPTETDGGPPAADSAGGDWYYTQRGRRCGPVRLSHLQSLVAGRQVGPDDLVWTEGMADWSELRAVAGRLWKRSPAPQAPVEAVVVPEQKSTLAILSLVFGVLGITILFLIGSIAAVVLGHAALKQIDTSGGSVSGRGLAMSGLVLGYIVVLACAVSGVVVTIVLLAGSVST